MVSAPRILLGCARGTYAITHDDGGSEQSYRAREPAARDNPVADPLGLLSDRLCGPNQGVRIGGQRQQGPEHHFLCERQPCADLYDRRLSDGLVPGAGRAPRAAHRPAQRYAATRLPNGCYDGNDRMPMGVRLYFGHPVLVDQRNLSRSTDQRAGVSELHRVCRSRRQPSRRPPLPAARNDLSGLQQLS